MIDILFTFGIIYGRSGKPVLIFPRSVFNYQLTRVNRLFLTLVFFILMGTLSFDSTNYFKCFINNLFYYVRLTDLLRIYLK